MSRFTPGTLVKFRNTEFIVIQIKYYTNRKDKIIGKVYFAVNLRHYIGDVFYGKGISQLKRHEINRIRKLTNEELLTHERAEVRAIALKAF